MCKIFITLALLYFIFVGLGLMSYQILYSKTHDIGSGCKLNTKPCWDNDPNPNTVQFRDWCGNTDCTIFLNSRKLMCAMNNRAKLWAGCMYVGMHTFLAILFTLCGFPMFVVYGLSYVYRIVIYSRSIERNSEESGEHHKDDDEIIELDDSYDRKYIYGIVIYSRSNKTEKNSEDYGEPPKDDNEMIELDL